MGFIRQSTPAGWTMNEKKNWMLTAWTVIENKQHVLLLFGMLVMGILANWFWTLGWAYIGDPSSGLAFGSPLEMLIRVILSLIAAALTFVPTYNKIGQSSQESWVPYFLAFQNGFFWEATFYTLTKAFGG